MNELLAGIKRWYEREKAWVFGLAGMSGGWAYGGMYDNRWGGFVIAGAVLFFTVIFEVLRSRAQDEGPEIGSLHERPILYDYRRVLLTPTADEFIKAAPMIALAQADLVIMENDKVVKDRYGEPDVIHPGLFRAAQVLPGSRVLDLTDETTLTRVQSLASEKAGRGDLWGYTPEVVREGFFGTAP